MWSVHEVTRLRAMPDSSGIPETSATQLRDWDGKILPKLSADYVEVEYLLSGLASSYDGPVTGPVRMVSDGHRYVTRLLVRYPRQSARFSGRVVIEPFNTTYGVDRDALWLARRRPAAGAG